VIEKPPFSIIVALDGRRVHLVRQLRYPVGESYWELPQGTFETAPDTDPSDVARGELAEETGLVAGTMTHVGRLFNAYGFSSQAMHVFIAQDLVQGALQREPSEQDMRTDAFDIDEVDGMIERGEIVDACTIAAWHLVRKRLS
jgi:ADP-ribose pyrophosphatase